MVRNKKLCGKCKREISLSNFNKHTVACLNKKATIKIKQEWFQKNGLYKCPDCGKEYSKQGLGYHIWKNHTDEGKIHDCNVGYKKGIRISWNKGLNSKNDKRIRKQALRLKKAYKVGDLVPKWKNKLKPQTIENSSRKGIYKILCGFKFNLADFKEEFDFDLIKKYGWYKAKNKGNNLKGVSRDHLVSIEFGFINNIEPEIIRHPANCKLMIHNENSSKHTKNGIDIKMLVGRIKYWNEKYGYPMPKGIDVLSIDV